MKIVLHNLRSLSVQFITLLWYDRNDNVSLVIEEIITTDFCKSKRCNYKEGVFRTKQ